MINKFAVDFWTAKDMAGAKNIIHSGNWEQAEKPTIDALVSPTVRKLLGHKLDDKVALEIGCGVGRLMVPMSKLFAHVWGVDITPMMISLSEEYLRGVNNVTPLLLTSEHFPLPDNHIDFVYSIIVFQHIPYRNTIVNYLKEVRRVLKPGGVVIIQTQSGIPGGGNGAQWHGYLYKTIDAFAAEFVEAGLFVVLKQGTSVPDKFSNGYLYVTATKEPV